MAICQPVTATEYMHDELHKLSCRAQVIAVSKRILEKENIIVDNSALIPSDDSYFMAGGDFPYDIAFNWVKRNAN